MALQGTFYGTTANENIQPKIQWTAVQSVSGNYSDITATLSYSRTNTGYTTEGDWAGSLTIGSSTASAAGIHLQLTHNSNTEAITHTARVYHREDGSLSVTISASGGITNPSSSTLKNTAISATVELDPIPRHTTLADASGIIGKTVSLILTKRSTDFYHSLRYKNPVDGRYYYIDEKGNSVEAETLLKDTVVPFTVPELYKAIANSRSGTVTIECWTYPTKNAAFWLQDCTTAIFTYKADESQCAPSIAATVTDTNDTVLSITGDSSVLVRYASNARLSLTAAAKDYATIEDPARDVSVQYKGLWRYDGDLTFDFDRVEQETFLLWVRDSRGYETYSSVSARSFVPYVPLTNNAFAKRLDQTGSSVVLTFAGNYYAGKIHTAQNILRLWYRLEGQSDWTEVTQDTPGVSWSVDAVANTYKVELTLEELSYTSAFSVQTCVRDLLGQKSSNYDVYKTVVIPAGLPVFDWGKEDFRFNVPVYASQINGICMRSVYVWQSSRFTIQSKFSQWEEAGARQSFFLCGSRGGTAVLGVIIADSSGSCTWTGQPAITVTAQAGGGVQVELGGTAYDRLMLLSAEPFTIR